MCLVFPNLFSKNFLVNDVQVHPPLGLAYIASTLREAGAEVVVIDAAAERLDMKNVLNRVSLFSPDLVGITTNISLAEAAVRTARTLRTAFPSMTLVMGGPWAAVERKRLIQNDVVDVVVVGEGERTMVDLARVLKESSELSSVEGIAYKDPRGEVRENHRRDVIKNLNTIPFPAWDLFPPNRKYNFVHRRSPFYPIMTSRGCPFDCIHCTKIIQGYSYRARDVENVIEEIRYLVRRFNAREILIVDDCFNLDPKRAEAIFDAILREGFDLAINFSNGIRADRFNTRLASKFKNAGVYTVSFGIESGNQDIVKKIGKKLDLKEVVKSVRLARKHGILTKGFFIIGHPFDTYDTMMESASFARLLDLDLPHFFKSIPFPGTKMHEMIREHGKMRRVEGGKRTEYYRAYTVKTANFDIWDLKAEDIERAFVNSYRMFYLRPLKLLRIIVKLKSFSELAWLFVSFMKIIIRYGVYR